MATSTFQHRDGLLLRTFLVLGCFVAAVAVYFVDLGGSSIWDANEAFYVETPREMIERGDYISPTFNYEPRLNKPVLSYWIVAGFYHLFGVSVGVQRLPIAIGGVVLIAVAFVLARAAWPSANFQFPVRNYQISPRPLHISWNSEVVGVTVGVGRWKLGVHTIAGLCAALGLAVSPRLMMFARRIFIDIYASMFAALTLMFFALSERYPERRRLFLILMYVSTGLGVLTKGPVFALLPGLVFALYLVVHREVHRVRDMLVPAGVVIVLAIVFPWYVALYQRDGWTYIEAFVFGENFARYTAGLGVNAVRGPLFYLPVVVSDSFPLSLLLFAAAANWFADRRAPSNDLHDPALRVRTLLWLWVLTIVVFFSISAAKQDLYIFPVVPAVAALGGIALVRGLVRGEHARAVRVSIALAGLALIVVGGGILYLFTGADAVYAVRGAMRLGAIGAIGGTATIALAALRQPGNAMLALTASLAAMNWTFVTRVLPSFEAYKPVPAVARVLEARLQKDDVVATYNVALPSLVYYLRRHVEMAYDPAPIRAFLESPETTAYVVLSRMDYDYIQQITSARTCIVSTHPTFDVKLRNILARDPLPDVLVIANRCP